MNGQNYTSYLICNHPPDRVNVFHEGLPLVHFVKGNVEQHKHVTREELEHCAEQFEATAAAIRYILIGKLENEP